MNTPKLVIRGPSLDAREDLDPETLQLRNEHISCLKLAQETDSKREDAFLRSEAHVLLIKLRIQCKHIYTVCLCSEYEGSYTDDYSDSHPEERICLSCATRESVSQRYGDKFKTLAAEPFARFEGKCPDQIKNPLSYLLSETIEIALAQGYRYFSR